MMTMRDGQRASGSAHARARRTMLVPLMLSVLLTCLLPGGTRAHALVVASIPAANSAVGGDEVAIDLQFNSRLDQKRARLRVLPAAGEPIEVPLAPAEDEAHLRARVGGLTPGDYRIEWYVLSPDGHVTRGHVPFTVTPR